MMHNPGRTKARQLTLFEEQATLPKIVNVASVPLRSPFRYPGGKTWLVPSVRQWIASLALRPAEFIEPFAGGGIVGLTVAFERLADRVIMIELDDQIADVWETVLNGDGEWLAERISDFYFTPETVQTVLSSHGSTRRERAFQTIIRNRVNRGGILAEGAGMLKKGEDGKGLASRWYPQTLSKRIRDIVAIRDRIAFVRGNGIEILKQKRFRLDTMFFIDPPYTLAGKKAGSRLYNHSEIDHEELFNITATLSGDFLMTYNEAEEIYQFAQKRDFDTQAVLMKNTHHTKMRELLIGRNLNWIR